MFFSILPTTSSCHYSFFFFFNDTATTEIYTLSLHDALPICLACCLRGCLRIGASSCSIQRTKISTISQNLCSGRRLRSEEHTSELQSRQYLVCRLLLEKKKIKPCTISLLNLPTQQTATCITP